MKVMREHEHERHRWHLVVELTNQFIQRKDIYAIQLSDGRYVSIPKPFTLELMYRHLQGKLTLGAYLLDPEDNTTSQLILDADNNEQFERLKHMAGELAVQQVPTYLETSRRGGHLRLFFEQPVSGQKARRLGLQLLSQQNLQLEIFPKQEAVGDGPGSLMRIPFGVHQLTGKRYGLTNQMARH